MSNKDGISEEEIDNFISSLGGMSDAQKIEFIVRRKFPGYNTLPPISTLHSRVNPATVEAHKEQSMQGNAYKDELKAIARDDLEALWQQECLFQAEERKIKEDNRFFNRSNAGADASWKYAALVTIEEAIALAFNKNPEIVNWKSVKPYVNVSPFAKRYKQLRNLAIRAVAAEILSDPVIPKDFTKWREPLKYEISDVVAELLEGPEDCPTEPPLEVVQERGNDNGVSTGKGETLKPKTEDTFDPLPIGGIAKIFKLTSDRENNLEQWKKHARRARENSLVDARVRKIGGSGGSLFEPMLVGDWIVKKGFLSRWKVNRLLKGNLPERSVDMAYLFEVE